MTRRKRIMNIFRETQDLELTCAQVCALLVASNIDDFERRFYLSGVVSTTLSRLVKDNQLEYCAKLGPKGGRVYKLKTNEEKQGQEEGDKRVLNQN